MGETRGRPVAALRSDARRNRDAILRAARSLLAESGDVPMNEIARRAGVGQGTLYRHFPDRAAIAASIFDQHLDRIQSLLDEHRHDTKRLILILEGLADAFTQFHGLGEVVREARGAHQERRLFDRFTHLIEGPLVDARSAGYVKADVTVADMLLLCGILDGALLKVNKPADRAATARRVIEIVMHGLMARPCT